jgi:hypothetical protein
MDGSLSWLQMNKMLAWHFLSLTLAAKLSIIEKNFSKICISSCTLSHKGNELNAPDSANSIAK